MTVRRTLARVAFVGAGPLLLAGLVAAPAQAHGAPDNPISRTVACGPEGGQNVLSAACKAAIAVNGAQPFAEWDNLRVPDVRGRDRQVVPDGKLCSGGLAAYRGLDLPRADWPATKLTAGASFTFRYRETIPHKGTFRMYVTKDGYDPSRPLTWSDVESKPFLTATDPALVNDAYVMRGKLPAGKSGRHLIYTIWQNTSTPDTYYSCSDAVFTGGGAGAGGSNGAANGSNGAGSGGTGSNGAAPNVVPPNAGGANGAAPASAGAGAASAGAAASDAAAPQQPGAGGPATVAVSRASSQGSAIPLILGGGGLLAVVAAAGVVLLRRRRALPPNA